MYRKFNTPTLWVLSCLPFFCLLLIITVFEPGFFTYSGLERSNVDAIHYWRIAENLIHHGQFSRSISAPFIPDFIRVPLYPFIIAFIRLIHDSFFLVYLLQGLLYGGACVLMYKINMHIFGNLTTGISSLALMSLNISAVIFCFFVMTEIVFIFLFLAFLYRLLIAESSGTVKDYCIAGFLLGLSTLQKPLTFHLGFILLLLIPVLSLVKKTSIKQGTLCSVAMFCVFLLTISPWLVRNYMHFGIAKLSSLDVHHMIYFIGSPANDLYHGRRSLTDQADGWAEISNQFSIPNYPVIQNLHNYHEQYPLSSYKKLYAQLDDVKFDIVFQHPKELFMSSLLGVIGSHLSVNLHDYARRIFDEPIKNAGSISKASISNKLKTLFSNRLDIVIMFFYQYLYLALLLFFAIIGLLKFLIDKSISLSVKILIILIFGYTFLNIIGVGFYANQRTRMVTDLFYYIFASYGLSQLISKIYPNSNMRKAEHV